MTTLDPTSTIAHCQARRAEIHQQREARADVAGPLEFRRTAITREIAALEAQASILPAVPEIPAQITARCEAADNAAMDAIRAQFIRWCGEKLHAHAEGRIVELLAESECLAAQLAEAREPQPTNAAELDALDDDEFQAGETLARILHAQPQHDPELIRRRQEHENCARGRRLDAARTEIEAERRAAVEAARAKLTEVSRGFQPDVRAVAAAREVLRVAEAKAHEAIPLNELCRAARVDVPSWFIDQQLAEKQSQERAFNEAAAFTGCRYPWEREAVVQKLASAAHAALDQQRASAGARS